MGMLKRIFASGIDSPDSPDYLKNFTDDFVTLQQSHREKSRSMARQVDQCILTIISNIDNEGRIYNEFTATNCKEHTPA